MPPLSPQLGPVSRKSRKLFKPQKPFVKLRPTYPVKLVFWYVLKGMKINITAIFRVSERLHFEVIKRPISPEKFQDFRERGTWREPWVEPETDAMHWARRSSHHWRTSRNSLFNQMRDSSSHFVHHCLEDQDCTSDFIATNLPTRSRATCTRESNSTAKMVSTGEGPGQFGGMKG